MNKLTRRQFTKTVAATAAAAFAGAALPRDAAAQAAALLRFPAGFLWGCATSAYQIEGAAAADGRGPSNWDVFSHTPGKTHHGDTGDVADDSYHLYKEDVRLLKDLGAKVYRFSISWSRIFPERAPGKPNEHGLAYYQRLIDELLPNGIEPYVTLFHWDLPQALPGGWQSRDTSEGLCRLRRVRREQAIGPRASFHDDQRSRLLHRFKLSNRSVRTRPQTARRASQSDPSHGLLAHGLGVQAIRAHSESGTQVGLAENPKVLCAGHRERRAHRSGQTRLPRRECAVSHRGDGGQVHRWLSAARSSECAQRSRRATSRSSAVRSISSASTSTRPSMPAPMRRSVRLRRRAAARLLFRTWRRLGCIVGPEVIYWTIRHTSELWKPRALYITENGCSAEDVVDRADGRIEDTDRVMFLRNYVTQLQRAATEGYPIKGLFPMEPARQFRMGGRLQQAVRNSLR